MNNHLIAGFTSLTLILCAISAFSQESAPPLPPAEKTEKSEPTDDEKLDQELEKVLLPAEAQETPAEVLDRAVNTMRDAGERIEAGKAGQETRQMQQKVIVDLARLIELLQNRPPPQPNQNNPQPQQPQQKQKPRPQDPKKQQQNQQQQEQESKKERKPDDAGESQERLDKAKEARRQAAARARLFKDIWGHLPETVRNELRNNFSEEYLPKYALEVRQYFEELAKRNRAESPR